MLVDVPPTSSMIPSRRSRWWRAPATDAAGPENRLRSGRAAKPLRSVAPPSPRRTTSGASTPASLRPAATTFAVAWARGRMAALTSAETVRSSRPRRLVSSCPAQAGRPRSRATSRKVSSPVGSSTAKASLTASDPAPAAIELVDHRRGRLAGHAARAVHEPVLRLQDAAGRERQVADVRPFAGRTEVRLLADAHEADRRQVALEEGVDREGRRMADHEDRTEAALVDGPGGMAQDHDHAFGDAVRGRVAGRDDGARDDLAGDDVDRGGFGEGPTDVDPETDGHVRSPAGEWRAAGRAPIDGAAHRIGTGSERGGLPDLDTKSDTAKRA